jgi:hypothetical protein
MNELMLRRFVPIGVEPQEFNVIGRALGNRVLHPALDKVDLGGGVRDEPQGCLDLLQGRGRPIVPDRALIFLRSHAVP